jgi:O-antigen ligase
MLLILGIVIISICVVVALLSPQTGLMIYWAWFIVRPQEIVLGLGGELPLERILVLALIASLVIHRRLFKGERFLLGRISWAFLGFLGVCYLSILTAVWRGGALVTANDLATTFVFFFCFVNLITGPKDLRRFLWVYVIAIGWEAASSLWAFGAHPYFAQGIQRATSLEVTWGDPNITAANLALTLPILAVLLKGTRGFVGKSLLVGLGALYLICIVLTGSRGGAVLTVVVFLALALQSSKRMLLIPTLFGCLALAWVFVPPEYQERYRTLLELREDLTSNNLNSSQAESAQGRLIGFEVAMQMFMDRPILGVGCGDFAPAWWARDLPYSYHGLKGWHQPHNLPGQLLSELGLLGALSFGFLIFTILRQGRAARRALQALHNPAHEWLISLTNAVVIVLVALFAGGLSGHNLYRYNWYLAGALIVVVVRIAEQEKAAAQAGETDYLETVIPLPGLEEVKFIDEWAR